MKITLVRYVRSREKGWIRRKVVVPKKTRGWESRLDIMPELYGDDVEALGQYQLRWYKDKRLHYRPVGRKLIDAITALEQQAQDFAAERAAKEAGPALRHP